MAPQGATVELTIDGKAPQLVVDNTVAKVKGARFSEKLRRVTQEMQEGRYLGLPDQAWVVFHNSVRGDDHGGWHSGNYPTWRDRASLMYNFGKIRSRGISPVNRIDLPPRRPLDSLPAWVRRALKEAQANLDNARFMRNWDRDYRRDAASVRLGHVLEQLNIGAVRSETYRMGPYMEFAPDGAGVLLLVAQNAIGTASTALLAAGCRGLPALEGVDATRHFLFDDISVVLAPLERLGRGIFKVFPKFHSNAPMPYYFEKKPRA